MPVAILVLLTLANLALAVLMVAVSGFILQGVNNQGPMMPEAIAFVALLIATLLAPATAWLIRKRAAPAVTGAVAAAPLAVAALLLVASPS